MRQDEELIRRGEAREIVNRMQRQKKLCRTKPEDDIVLFYELSPALEASFKANRQFIQETVKKPILPRRFCQVAAPLGSSE